MKERVFTFGPDEILMGVLTEPDPAVARAGAPVVIFSNVGLNARIGPYRLWVSLARALAKVGLTSFRFDLNGLGDSAARRDTRAELERAVADHVDALDFVQKKRGATRFAIVSMCSGTDPGHRLALADPRVCAGVFLDGYSYETRRSRLRWSVGRHLTRAGLVRNLRRRLPRVITAGATEETAELNTREYPPPAQLAAELEQLVTRGVKLKFIFSGGLWQYFNYPEQFLEMLPTKLSAPVEVEIRKEADHVYMLPGQREHLVSELSAWFAREFQGP